jgi:hypothetical protein
MRELPRDIRLLILLIKKKKEEEKKKEVVCDNCNQEFSMKEFDAHQKVPC